MADLDGRVGSGGFRRGAGLRAVLVLFQIVALNVVFAARSIVTVSAMTHRVEIAMAAMLAAFWFFLRLSRSLARIAETSRADDGLDRAAGVRQSDGLGLTSGDGSGYGMRARRLAGRGFMTGVSWIFQVRLSAE